MNQKITIELTSRQIDQLKPLIDKVYEAEATENYGGAIFGQVVVYDSPTPSRLVCEFVEKERASKIQEITFPDGKGEMYGTRR